MLAVLLAPALPGQTLNTLHGFSHNELGYETHSGVTVGPNGEIYGATAFGGAYGLGLVYALAPPTSPGGAWTEILLHSFSAAEGQPAPGLLLGPAGAIYGATEFSDSGEGEIFELEPPTGAGTYWREAILHVFSPSNGDGEDPGAAPVFGQQSALYGSTVTGGSIGGGTVYRLSPPSTKAGAWSEQILYSFAGYHGDAKDPLGALALGSQGALYGASLGGAYAIGAVFQLVPPVTPGGAWTEAVLHSFGGEESDWALPNGVLLGADGSLYGTTMGSDNGRQCPNGCGTFFQLSPPGTLGGAWTETILHSFTGLPTGDGSQPDSALVLGPGGELFGTTQAGGPKNLGTIFEMLPPASPGGAWTVIILHTFNGADGGYPNAVTFGPDGNLYGTTSAGGPGREGTVFQLVLE